MGRRRAVIGLVALALLGTACSSGGEKKAGGAVDDDVAAEAPAGPQTYKVAMDAPSPDGKNVQTAVFFPTKVKVRPGDTVIFENQSTQAPHTVSFGFPAFDPEGPKLVTKAGAPNPVVFGPCYNVDQPGKDAEACPAPPAATPPGYTGGNTYYNSGAVAPGGSFSLTFAPDIEPNVYTYSCLLHRFMGGAVEVVEADTDRVSPQAVAKELQNDRDLVVASNERTIAEPAPEANVVTAGWGNDLAAVNRFSPAVMNIKVGQTVTWKGASSFEPHTVTFESPFKSPEEQGVFTPGGVKNGGRYSGGFSNSGIFGPEAFFPKGPFSLTFTKAGTFSYICALHPGMAGEVHVTP